MPSGTPAKINHDELIRLYRDEGWSLTRLQAKYGATFHTVKRILIANNVALRPSPTAERASCGTERAYRAHRYRFEEPDEECRQAHSEYMAAYYQSSDHYKIKAIADGRLREQFRPVFEMLLKEERAKADEETPDDTANRRGSRARMRAIRRLRRMKPTAYERHIADARLEIRRLREQQDNHPSE